MCPAGKPGNVEIMTVLVHEWISVIKYPSPGPGINNLSMFGIFVIFELRWALAAGRPPGTLPKPIDVSQNVEN